MLKPTVLSPFEMPVRVRPTSNSLLRKLTAPAPWDSPGRTLPGNVRVLRLKLAALEVHRHVTSAPSVAIK